LRAGRTNGRFAPFIPGCLGKRGLAKKDLAGLVIGSGDLGAGSAFPCLSSKTGGENISGSQLAARDAPAKPTVHHENSAELQASMTFFPSR